MPFRLLLSLLLFSAWALGHETQTVGEGDAAVNVIVGYRTEPPFTDKRNGLDLMARRASDNSPIANLEQSLVAELIAPEGSSTRTLRAVHGQPGRYTDDFILSQTGVYAVRIYDFIGSEEVDLRYDLHEVGPLDDLRFP